MPRLFERGVDELAGALKSADIQRHASEPLELFQICSELGLKAVFADHAGTQRELQLQPSAQSGAELGLKVILACFDLHAADNEFAGVPDSPATAIAEDLVGAVIGGLVSAINPESVPVWYDQRYAPQLTDVQRILRGEALLNPASAGKEAAGAADNAQGGAREGTR